MKTEMALRMWRARRRSGKTYTQIANETGISSRTIDSWINGIRVPGSEGLAKFAASVGVTTDSLLSHYVPASLVPVEQGEK